MVSVKRICGVWFFALCQVLTFNLASAQDQRFNVTLDDSFVSKLIENGQLKSSVRTEQDRKQIGFVMLQFQDTKSKSPVDLELEVNVDGEVIAIDLDDEIISTIKGQPIRVRLKDAALGFKTLVMNYQKFKPAPPAPLGLKDKNGKDLNVVFFRLDDSSAIAGGIEGLTSVSLGTKFGKFEFPFEEIAGIRFNIDEQKNAMVVLINGDSMTGSVEMKKVSVVTDWGKADIEISHLESITMTPESRFRNSSTGFGPRWNMDPGSSIAPGRAPAAVR